MSFAEYVDKLERTSKAFREAGKRGQVGSTAADKRCCTATYCMSAMCFPAWVSNCRNWHTTLVLTAGVCRIVAPDGWSPRKSGYNRLNFELPRCEFCLLLVAAAAMLR